MSQTIQDRMRRIAKRIKKRLKEQTLPTPNGLPVDQVKLSHTQILNLVAESVGLVDWHHARTVADLSEDSILHADDAIEQIWRIASARQHNMHLNTQRANYVASRRDRPTPPAASSWLDSSAEKDIDRWFSDHHAPRLCMISAASEPKCMDVVAGVVAHISARAARPLVTLQYPFPKSPKAAKRWLGRMFRMDPDIATFYRHPKAASVVDEAVLSFLPTWGLPMVVAESTAGGSRRVMTELHQKLHGLQSVSVLRVSFDGQQLALAHGL